MLPALLLVPVLYRESANSPASDDYWSLLPFLCNWTAATGFAEHWHLLTDQFIGHRIVFTKLAVIADLAAFGRSHLGGLQMFGLVGWLAAIGTLLTSVPAVRRSPWLALPVTLLLLHPQGYSSLLAAIGLGNQWVVTFAVLAFLCLNDPRPRGLGLALLFAGLAPLCFANGLLVFPAGVLALLLRQHFRRAAVFAGAGIAVWALYLHGYDAVMGSLSLAELARKTAIMTGGFAALGRMPVAGALVVGSGVLLGALALLGWPWLRRELPAHLGFLIFCGLTVLMAARGRAGWADDYMLQDRYRLYGLLLVAVIYLAAVSRAIAWRRPLGLAAGGLAALYCFFSYATHLAPMGSARRWYDATAMNAQIGVSFPHGIPADWPGAKASLDRAVRAGVYQLPEFLSAADLAVIGRLPESPAAGGIGFELRPDGSICGHYLLPPAGTPVPEFAVMVDATGRVILPVARFRARVSDLPRLRSFLAPDFGLVVPEAIYQAGNKTVYGLGRDASGALQVAFTARGNFP